MGESKGMKQSITPLGGGRKERGEAVDTETERDIAERGKERHIHTGTEGRYES